MKRVEWFIAMRLVFTKRKLRFINVIGIVSIVGIAAGVAALIIAMSVFNGFSGVVTSVLVSFDPHLRIEKRGGMEAQELAALTDSIAEDPEVLACSPFLSGKAMLVANSATRVVVLRGVDQGSVIRTSGLGERLLFGNVALYDSSGVPGIILGLTLADRLGTVVGEKVAILTPYALQGAVPMMSLPASSACVVQGIFDSRNKDYDANYAYIALDAAQQLFRSPGKVQGLEVRLKDLGEAEAVKDRLSTRLPSTYRISTWYDLHRSLYSVMKLERWAAFVLLSLIIIVATFNMLGSLTMGVLEKRRDIGVLRTMGMTQNGIVRVFLVEGLMTGVAGTVIGLVGGLVVLYLQTQYQLFPLDTSIYIIPAIPVELHLSDVVLVALSSLFLSFLAAYYPARRAALVLPAQAVRWE